MSMFTLAISCLTTSNLLWFMDLTFQIPMQYCSLQHWTLHHQSHPQWVLFLLWLYLFILSGVTSKLTSSSIFSQFSPVQSLSHVWLFETPWIAACQASLSITNSWSSLKLMSIESVMPSSHLILCRPLLLLPPIPPSIRSLFQWVSSSHEVAKVLEFQP